MSYAEHHQRLVPVAVAILTVSDTKGPATDESGDRIERGLRAAGHAVHARAWARDEPEEIRGRADDLLSDPRVDALVVTGGTGVSPRDVTVDTLRPRFEKELPGFGEYLRALSAITIRSGAVLSRATAGLVRAAGRSKPVFLLPGAPDACHLAVAEVIAPEVGHLVQLANPEVARHA